VGRMTKNRKQILSTLLCILFITMLVLSSSFIVTHEHHDCTGEKCPVCAQIQIAVNILNSIKAAIVPLLSFIGLLSCNLRKAVAPCAQEGRSETLVKLKVKLSN